MPTCSVVSSQLFHLFSSSGHVTNGAFVKRVQLVLKPHKGGITAKPINYNYQVCKALTDVDWLRICR